LISLFKEMKEEKFFKLLSLPAFISFLFFPLNASYLPTDPAQENAFSPKNILSFAEHLYQEGDYLRAAGEFQRYLFCFETIPPDADSIFFKIALCFRAGKNFQKSLDYFQGLVRDFPQSSYLDEARYQLAYVYFLMGKYKESLDTAQNNFSLIQSEKHKLKIQQLHGLNFIYQKKWLQALQHFNSFDETSRNNPLTLILKNLAEEGKNLPHKSKFLAGLMSAIIPGTGKIYARRTADGLFSLLTIGVTSWQAYDGFRKDRTHSVKGWIYGALSAFFYLGNIYGSVVAVNIYNGQLENTLLKKAGVTVDVYFQ